MTEKTIIWDNTLSSATLSNENKTATLSNTSNYAIGSAKINEGKWYWEYTFNSLVQVAVGVVGYHDEVTKGNVKTVYSYDGNKASPRSSYTSSFGVNAVIGVLLDMDNGTIEFSIDGSRKGVAFSDLKQFDHVRPYFGLTTSSTSSINIVTSSDKLNYYKNGNFLPLDDIFFKKYLLLKSNNKIYAIHEQEDNGENLSKNVVNVTASGGTTPRNTIDGNTTISQSYSWYSTNLPSAWIKYEFNQPIHIDKIKILSVYFSGYEAIRNFQIEGSNTGDFTGEEVVIYSGTHPNDTTKDFVTYSFRNSGKFKFYRINVFDIYVGNGNNNLSIIEVEFYSNLTELIQVPKYSVNNFVEYGKNYIGFDGLIFNKNYILQDGVSENADGLWVQEIDRKPLNIKFE